MFNLFHKYSSIITEFFVLLAGLLSLQVPQRALAQSTYIEGYIYIFLVYALWFLFRRSTLTYINRTSSSPQQETPRRTRHMLSVFGLIATGLLLTFTLHGFKLRAPDGLFAIVLTTMVIDAGAFAARKRQYQELHILLRFSALSLVAYSTMHITQVSFEWQSLAFSLALAAEAVALEIAAHSIKRYQSISDNASNDAAGRGEDWDALSPNTTRIYTLLVALGPLFIALIAAAKQLPANYLGLCLLIPIARPFRKGTVERPQSDEEIRRYTRDTAVFFLLFAAVLLLLGLWYAYIL